MIAAYDDAYAKGLGAVQYEGAMIDVPVVERARSVVKRAAALLEGDRLRAAGQKACIERPNVASRTPQR